jgi:threonine dehydrogenase-like Zn-dependent dehydrogenase
VVRQVRLTESGLALTEADAPSGEGVRVRVTSAGICGSDLHMLAGGASTVVLGHEFGGRLDDGSLVAVRPSLPCGSCTACTAGNEHLCSQIRRHFYGASLDGGLADEVMVDERCLVPIPGGVDPTTVALVEPLAVAVHAANRIVAGPLDRILVIGGGSIGLACAAVLIDRGYPVDVSARHAHQRTAALSLGASVETGRRYSTVVDAAGTTTSLSTAADLTRSGGQIVLVALLWESVVLPPAVPIKELTLTPSMLYGSHEGDSEFASAAGLLARHPEIADALVTHRFPLDDATTAFATAANRSAGAIKVHLLPSGEQP